MNKKLYILCGIPASGKSTWARISCIPGDVIVSRDKIRFSILKDDEEYFSHEDEVFDVFINEINTMLNSISVNRVFVDATHLNEKSRNKVLDRLNLENVDIAAVNFLDDVDICLEHNELRSGRAYVPPSSIKRMAANFVPAAEGEKYKYKKIFNKKDIFSI